MAGLYLHIPFCRTRCIYCDFYSTVGEEMQARYVEALLSEWRLRRGELRGEPVDTIYIGGGTLRNFRPDCWNDFLRGFRPISIWTAAAR